MKVRFKRNIWIDGKRYERGKEYNLKAKLAKELIEKRIVEEVKEELEDMVITKPLKSAILKGEEDADN